MVDETAIGGPINKGAADRPLITWLVRLVPAAGLLLLWHIWATNVGSLMIATPIDTLSSFLELLRDPEMWEAFWVSNQALVIGFGLSVIVGLPLGLVMGRFRVVERLADVWVNVMLITPMAMILPIVIMAFGFSLAARSFIVVLFCFPMIVVNSRAGVREVDKRVIEMATSFRATEPQLWRHILLPGAAPAIWAGIRIGIGRAVSGMIIVEMLLVAVGLGELLLRYRGLFNPSALFAVVAIVVIEAMLLVSLARRLERRLTPWSSTGFVTQG